MPASVPQAKAHILGHAASAFIMRTIPHLPTIPYHSTATFVECRSAQNEAVRYMKYTISWQVWTNAIGTNRASTAMASTEWSRASTTTWPTSQVLSHWHSNNFYAQNLPDFHSTLVPGTARCCSRREDAYLKLEVTQMFLAGFGLIGQFLAN